MLTTEICTHAHIGTHRLALQDLQANTNFLVHIGCFGHTDFLIILFFIHKSNEVKNSSAMEQEGLIRVVRFLAEHGANIHILVTDRHVQTRAWIKTNLPDTLHYFDIWHVDKSKRK